MTPVQIKPAGSPKFKLFASDALPIVKKGGWAALGAFITVGVVPLLPVAIAHWPILAIAGAAISAGLAAVVQWASDNSKG